MTLKHFLTLCVVGGALATAGFAEVGCGNGGTGGTGMGGGSASHSSSSTGTHTGPTSSASSGSGGAPADNHTIDGATSIMIDGMTTSATLVDTTTSDFYTFMGKAGDRLFIQVSPTNLKTNSNPALVDPAFGLYGANKDTMKPLTYQSRGWPGYPQSARLYVELPADGAYYIGLADCNGFFSMGCPNPAMGVTDLAYDLIVVHTNKLNVSEFYGTSANGTTATALPVAYKLPTGGKAPLYLNTIFSGDFKTAGETHVFSFTPPADSGPMAPARARAEFYVQPIGGGKQGEQGGDTSAANVTVWVTDSTGNVILARADQSKFIVGTGMFSPLEFSVPYTPGKTYYLFVKNEGAGGTEKDFYFVEHHLNPLIDSGEVEGPTMKGMNDTAATAETLTGQGSAKHFFTVDGNISAPGATGDIDWFTFKVPAAVTQYQIQCDAARSGSGLGGLTAQLFQADHVTSIAMGTETADADLFTPAATLPAAVTAGSTVFLQVTAATQDGMVAGTQYRCYVFFG